MRSGLRRRVILASGALAVLIGAAFVILIVTILSLRSESRGRARSDEIITTAHELETLVLNLETGARGYAITRRGVYLKPWETANETFPVIADRLVELSTGDPVRERRARELRVGIKAYEETWASLLILTAARDPAAARTLVLHPEGQRQVDRLRKQVDVFVDAEQARVDRSRAKTARQETYAATLGVVGLTGSLVLIGLFAAYVSRRVVEPIRRVAAAAQRVAGGELAYRVAPSGHDETAELGENFNTMAESIERQQQELAGQNSDLERLATVLREVIDSTVDGIALTDLEGDVQLANRPLLRLAEELGLRAGTNIIDRLLSLRASVADPERFVATMERLRSNPDPSADEFELVDPYRVFVGFTAPVRSDTGDLMGRIWTLREVTQERELDRLKDDFVATVSHELRTPLTSMMGFLEMVRDGEAGALTSEQERFLSIVHRSSERLQRLVGDLLFVARLDASGLQLQLAEGVRLDEVVAEAVESATPLARSSELALDVSLDGAITVRGDRERLGQLLGNLLSNAIKFTPAGGTVTVRAFADGGLAIVDVEDTGIGVPLAEQEQLFDRFFRSSTATERAIPGTGLGLAISKAIAEAHGGRVSFSSEPGAGTCFRVELPL